MELAGDEKRIQALFRELRCADEHVAPEFGSMWSRAQAIPPATFRSPRLAFALAMPLALIALCSLALWSRNTERLHTPAASVVNVPLQSGSSPLLPSVETTATQTVIVQSHRPVRANRSSRKFLARQRATDDAAMTVIPETQAISTWQSPTAMLLQSPADDMLATLPQLDLSARNLKTFLPDTLQ